MLPVLALLQVLASAPADTTYLVEITPAESLSVTEMGTGQPVLLIPGLFGSAYGFRQVLPLLAERGYRAIVIEPLGIGFSGRPDKSDYSLTAQSDRLARALGLIGADSAVVVGHTVGASIAYRLAVRHPEVVKAVVSLEGGPAESAMTASARAAMRFIPWVKWLGGMKLIRSRIRKGLIETAGDTSWVTDEVVEGYTAGSAVNIDRTLKAMLRMASAKEPEKLQPRLTEVRVPVRVLRGSLSKDGVPSSELEILAKSLGSLAVDTVEGSGLYIQEERPAAVVKAVDDVLLSPEAVAGSVQ